MAWRTVEFLKQWKDIPINIDRACMFPIELSRAFDKFYKPDQSGSMGLGVDRGLFILVTRYKFIGTRFQVMS
jgi:hypothetical protein